MERLNEVQVVAGVKRRVEEVDEFSAGLMAKR
jgi:hypothetical protein